MFNSPLLDLAISLVFIFLLYSLLATSINEMIAMSFSLRARMLRNAVAERMLSNVNISDNRWKSLVSGITEFLWEIVKVFAGKRKKSSDKMTLGDKFFNHPLIKNYGSSRIFHLPTYIPASNFSAVLVDELKKEFDFRIHDIARYKAAVTLHGNQTEDVIRQNLLAASDYDKVRAVIDYYSSYYLRNEVPPHKGIDRDLWQVLQLHLHESSANIENFVHRLERWFDDTMNGVSGWYKRQTQVLLFIIGVIMAILFNVDTIQISTRLSEDKKLLAAVTKMAEQYYEDHKNDTLPGFIAIADTSKTIQELEAQYRLKLKEVETRKSDIDQVRNLIAFGWGDYGMKRDSARVLAAYQVRYNKRLEKAAKKKEEEKEKYMEGWPVLTSASTDAERGDVLIQLYSKGCYWNKFTHVIGQCASPKKLLGLFITAFAICLGAPFWFDVLNKVARIRATSKKEDFTPTTLTARQAAAQQPVIINLTNQTGDDAVG